MKIIKISFIILGVKFKIFTEFIIIYFYDDGLDLNLPVCFYFDNLFFDDSYFNASFTIYAVLVQHEGVISFIS